MSSRRLPGKVIFPLANGYLLVELIIKRLQKMNGVIVVLATSISRDDDQLANVANEFGAEVYRGNLDNVALRTAECLKFYDIDGFARINGDSPFLNINLIEQGFELLSEGQLDLVSNIFPRTFPYGYSLEVIQSNSFLNIYKSFTPSEQEHITSHFYNHIDSFRYVNIVSSVVCNPEVRLTIDTRDDYNRVNKVLRYFPDLHTQPLEDILKAFVYVDNI